MSVVHNALILVMHVPTDMHECIYYTHTQPLLLTVSNVM